jgi:hypothetical protein
VRIPQRRVRFNAISAIRRNGQCRRAARPFLMIMSHKRLLLCKPADYEKRCADRGRPDHPPGTPSGARNGRLTAIFQLV